MALVDPCLILIPFALLPTPHPPPKRPKHPPQPRGAAPDPGHVSSSSPWRPRGGSRALCAGQLLQHPPLCLGANRAQGAAAQVQSLKQNPRCTQVRAGIQGLPGEAEFLSSLPFLATATLMQSEELPRPRQLSGRRLAFAPHVSEGLAANSSGFPSN